MNQRHTLMILGSGLMVLGLATLTGLFLFSPASQSARARASKDDSSPYPDIATLTQPALPQITPGTTPQQPSATPPTTTDTALIPSSPTATLNTPGASVVRPNTPATNQTPLTNPAQSAGATLWDDPNLHKPAVAATPVQRPKQNSTQVAKKTTQAKPAAPVKKVTPVAKPKPKPASPTTYWIQLGSFSSLARAKGAQEDMKNFDLSTTIEASDIGSGRLVYRLKTGAWSSKSEANTYLAQLKTRFPKFADAFVVNNRGVR